MGEFDFSFKIILLGDCGVGKSTMIRELSKKDDNSDDKCCCCSFTPNCNIDLVFRRHGRRIGAKIIDTGGQERYRSMTSSYFRGADGCLLMFDANSTTSFENTQNWYDTLETYSATNDITTIMVGTKARNSDHLIPEPRIHKMAENLELPYLNMDLSNTENIIQVLEELVDKMIRKYNKKPSSIAVCLRDPVKIKPERETKFKCNC